MIYRTMVGGRALQKYQKDLAGLLVVTKNFLLLVEVQLLFEFLASGLQVLLFPAKMVVAEVVKVWKVARTLVANLMAVEVEMGVVGEAEKLEA